MLIAGCDEVGRGPWAGPVITAAVILDASRPIQGLRDSKKLSAKAREQLARQIRENALCWALGQASVQEIEQLNILQASLLAMMRAIQSLSIHPQLVWVDGNQVPKQTWPHPEPAPTLRSQVGADDLIAEVSAASILAKVHRDQLMTELDGLYPGYGFAQHKGYGTAQHQQALQALGPCPIHRRSFAPIAAFFKTA